MSIDVTAGCGAHCGIASGREGHCDCDLCHDGTAPVVITREDLTAELRGTPMCARWYERAGDHRPWHACAAGCMCGMHGQALPEQHGKHCPVYQHWNRDGLLSRIAGFNADDLREPVTP